MNVIVQEYIILDYCTAYCIWYTLGCL